MTDPTLTSNASQWVSFHGDKRDHDTTDPTLAPNASQWAVFKPQTPSLLQTQVNGPFFYKDKHNLISFNHLIQFHIQLTIFLDS